MRPFVFVVTFTAVAIAYMPIAANETEFSEDADDIYEALVRKRSCMIHGSFQRYVGFEKEIEQGRVKIVVNEVRRRHLTQPLLVFYDKKGKAIGFVWAKEGTFSIDPKTREIVIGVQDANYIADDDTARFSGTGTEVRIKLSARKKEKSATAK